jgi:hypothetical protein
VQTRGKRRNWGRAAIVAAAIGFVATVFAMLARVEPIKVVRSRLGREGNAVFVEGLVRNTGPDAAAISLDVRYYDSAGRQLGGEDKVSVAGLRGGAETNFRSAPRSLPEARGFTIRIDRGPNPYGN